MKFKKGDVVIVVDGAGDEKELIGTIDEVEYVTDSFYRLKNTKSIWYDSELVKVKNKDAVAFGSSNEKDIVIRRNGTTIIAMQ